MYAGKDPVTGKHAYLSRTLHGSERKADRELSRLVAEVDEHGLSSTSASVAYLLGRFMALQRREQKAPTTLRTYQHYIDAWIVPAIGTAKLDRLTAGDLRDLYASMSAQGRSQRTIRQVRAIISSALSYATEQGWVRTNVGRASRAPKLPGSRQRVPTVTELHQLLEATASQHHAGPELAAAVILAASSGARLGELCALRWGDVVFEGERSSVLHIRQSAYVVPRERAATKATKTHQERRIVLDPWGTAALLMQRAHQERNAARVGRQITDASYVLSRKTDGSGPPRPDGYSAAFGRLRDKLAGWDPTTQTAREPRWRELHFHSLRHLAATTLIAEGVDVRTAASRLGHSDPSTTLRVYAHAVERNERAAAAILGSALALPPAREER